MEWSNDKIIDFLELFQTEPCLWDPELKAYKNRSAQGDAWYRIMQALPFPSTVEDLKKKKDTLMGYYRTHLNRHKKAAKSGEVYTTSWFAFDVMHSFLKPIYEGNKSEAGEPAPGEDGATGAGPPRLPHAADAVQPPAPPRAFARRPRNSLSNDEFDHFALMIAAKIRKIDDLYEREAVMNSIQNLVYQSVMKDRNSIRASCFVDPTDKQPSF